MLSVTFLIISTITDQLLEFVKLQKIDVNVVGLARTW